MKPGSEPIGLYGSQVSQRLFSHFSSTPLLKRRRFEEHAGE